MKLLNRNPRELNLYLNVIASFFDFAEVLHFSRPQHRGRREHPLPGQPLRSIWMPWQAGKWRGLCESWGKGIRMLITFIHTLCPKWSSWFLLHLLPSMYLFYTQYLPSQQMGNLMFATWDATSGIFFFTKSNPSVNAVGSIIKTHVEPSHFLLPPLPLRHHQQFTISLQNPHYYVSLLFP